jgi:DNA modification methylase
MFEHLRLTIDYWPIDKLLPYARNPRKNDHAVEKAASWIKEFGFRVPILAKSDGSIVDGHLRLKAAKKLGMKEIPVSNADDLTEVQIKAFRLSVNKMSELADWDDDLLKLELEELDNLQYDIDSLDFKDITLDNSSGGNDGLTDPDDVPEVAQNVFGVKRGDVFLLGNHRLMCGDSTSGNDVAKLMDGKVANIMMTDPPYGVKLDQSWRDAALGDKAMGKGNAKKIQNDDIADWEATYQLFKGNIAYVWHASKFSDVVMDGLRASGLEICQQLIWNKSVMVMGRSDYHFKHEPCWYAVRRGKTHDWIGDRKQTTIIDAASPNHIMSGSKEDKTEHPSQKPVACMELFTNHSGDVYEPFCGSGSTLIACEKTGRTCYGMELDEHYCSVIIKRWQDFSGKQAVKEG